MTKKKQRQKISSKKQLSTGRPVPVKSIKERKPEFKDRKPYFELIRFDKKVSIYIIVCLTLFLLFVSLKWHNSSIPYWNQVVNDGGDPDRGLLAGKPLRIRSDEWLVASSFILAQQKKEFPVSNEALGYGKTPLTFGLPTNHLVSIIRPTFWGYYFLDIERAFAWHWNFKIFPFLISSFLLLMLFTQNNFLLSIFGSIWLFLSSAIQWWSINTELFTFGCLSVISFIYILYSDKPKIIIVNGVLFIISSYSFAMVLYPAYQVPMAYFLFALILGYLIKNKNRLRLKFTNTLTWKVLTLGCSMAILLYLVYLFYHESKDTIEVITNTVYPGKRNEKGGDFSIFRLFTDNFSLFMSQEKFPSHWGNICEISSYLMLFPIASIIIVADFIKTKKTDPLLFSLLIFQFVIFIWFFVGFPEILAKLSFFNSSPTYRTFFVFGFSNVIATILFLSHHKNLIIKNNIVTKLILFFSIFILSYSINYLLNQEAHSFFSTTQVLTASIIFSCLNWLVIHFNENKIYRIAFYIICLLFIIPNIKINPLSKGLSPYYENGIYKTVSGINTKDPGSGWAVFGIFTYANFLKSAGINCFNGVQMVPPLSKLHVLDPEMKNESIYNRYAHIAFSTYIDGQDSVEFSLNQNDLYSINMDPCSPRLYEMGIKYFLFTYPPKPVEVEYMTPVLDTLGVFIYKRNEL